MGAAAAAALSLALRAGPSPKPLGEGRWLASLAAISVRGRHPCASVAPPPIARRQDSAATQAVVRGGGLRVVVAANSFALSTPSHPLYPPHRAIHPPSTTS